MKTSLMPAGNFSDEPQVQCAVPAAVEELQSAIATLESNAERLNDRLMPVLSGERNSDSKDSVRTDAMHSVPLAAELTALVDRVEALNYRTLDALDRLHV